MTVFGDFLRDIALKKYQGEIGNHQTLRGGELAKTLENVMAIPMRHRPSIRHRDGETSHRWFVPTSIKPPHRAKANCPQERDLGSQETSETDLRGDRSQRDQFLANITHLVAEVFAP
ncbi:hypothetical protein AY600_06385 [Phormidium willei BDU 130791]|nr:hypothetical protein AY600_06385 [Phormidium willei BDU 130791]